MITGNRGDGIPEPMPTIRVPRAGTFFAIEPAALPDVWREQLESLIAHAGHNTPGCSECCRLAQTVRILMRPFE